MSAALAFQANRMAEHFLGGSYNPPPGQPPPPEWPPRPIRSEWVETRFGVQGTLFERPEPVKKNKARSALTT